MQRLFFTLSLQHPCLAATGYAIPPNNCLETAFSNTNCQQPYRLIMKDFSGFVGPIPHLTFSSHSSCQ